MGRENLNMVIALQAVEARKARADQLSCGVARSPSLGVSIEAGLRSYCCCKRWKSPTETGAQAFGTKASWRIADHARSALPQIKMTMDNQRGSKSARRSNSGTRVR